MLDFKSLPKGVLDADFNEDNGISPQAAAEAFGFDSGRDLVKELMSEAQKYYDGDRAQRELPVEEPTGDED